METTEKDKKAKLIAELPPSERELAEKLSHLYWRRILDIAHAAAGKERQYRLVPDNMTMGEYYEKYGRRGDLDFPPIFGLMRGLRQPLFDTVIFLPSKHEKKDYAFVDNKKFLDDTPKTNRDTNMTVSGTLGWPLEYDIESMEIHFEEFETPEDLRKVLSGVHATWYYG